MMFCECKFCIYQKDQYCSISDTEHDMAGRCVEYIPVDIPKEDLDEYKRRHFERLANTEV